MRAQKAIPKGNKYRASAGSVTEQKTGLNQGIGFEDNRAETNAQKNLVAMAATNNSPIQRKEETDLKPGCFNMIGETHTDYPNENYRKYESTQIKKKLGSGNQYFSESQLKTQTSDKDFSDPLDLRVEQLVAFVKNETPDLASRMKSIQLDLLTNVKQQEDPKDKMQAVKIVEGLVSKLKLDKSTFDPKPIVDGFPKYSAAILEILGKSDAWLDVEYDQGLDKDPNFDHNAEQIQLEIERRLDSKSKTKKKTKAQIETEKAFQTFMLTDSFFEKYKGRIPRTLKLYYELKSRGDYSGQGKYDFSINEIPYILESWSKLDELMGMLRTTIYNQDFTHLKDFIEIAAAKLENILDGMLAGAEASKTGKVEKVIEKRSKKMHDAAQALASSNIAWKVGDLHIKDIRKLESKRSIPQTNYAYISKDNFKSNNFDEAAAKSYSGNAALADKTETHKTIGQADDMIAGHRDGLNGADEKAGASAEYKKGFRQGQKHLTDDIKSPRASRAIRRWLQRARKDNEWGKIIGLCAKDGGKVALLRAGLSTGDMVKMDPDLKIKFEEEYWKYDPTRFFLWRWSWHKVVRK